MVSMDPSALQNSLKQVNQSQQQLSATSVNLESVTPTEPRQQQYTSHNSYHLVENVGQHQIPQLREQFSYPFTFQYQDQQQHQQQQLDQCQSTSNAPFSYNNNCTYSSDIYDRLNFNPKDINFAEIQELWIRKDWSDILFRVAFVAPIVLLGILGNLTIIYSMYRFKPFRTKPTNIFILNLAIADLLTTMVCPIAALFTDIHQFYVLGSFICRFEGFVKMLSSDWLLCVVRPCRTRITIKQSWLALAFIWIMSVVMASPLFVWRKLRERQWRDLVEVWCCEMIQYTKYYWLVITFLLIYLPTFFMTIVLVIILAQMDRFEANLRRSRTAQTNGSLSINMKYRRRIVKILVTYLLTSIICWTPLQFTIIYRHFRSEAILSPWFFELAFYAQLSASLTAAMNPIIFGFLSEPFRRIVTKTWMFKFLDKILTTNGKKSGENRNAEALAMNQRSQINNNLNNLNCRSNQPKKFTQTQIQQTIQTNGHNINACSPPGTSRIFKITVRGNTSRSNHNQQQQMTCSIDNSLKRVSFNTDLPSLDCQHRTIRNDYKGQANAAYEAPEGESNIKADITGPKQQIINNKSNIGDKLAESDNPINITSFMQNRTDHIVHLSSVSLDSINIEENLGQATGNEETHG